MTRTSSDVAALAVAAVKVISNRQLIWRILAFRPIRVDSVVPCAILLTESVMVPAAAGGRSRLMSWNFSSTPVVNLPKKPAVRV